VAIAGAAFPEPVPGTGAVIIADAADFPDALTGGILGRSPLAAALGEDLLGLGTGPLLLVPSSGPVPPAVLAEVARQAPATVIALGGTDAVADEVLDQAVAAAQEGIDAALPPEPTGARTLAQAQRVGGATRLETAVEISQFAFPRGTTEVFLTTAADFPDALAAGKLDRGPILLVPSCGELPSDVAAELARLRPSVVTALGGEVAVCDGVLGAAAGTDATPSAPGYLPTACRQPLPVEQAEGRDVLCGTVDVPLDHADPNGETIRVNTHVFPAQVPDPAPDPVVVLGGGPGDKATTLITPLLASGLLPILPGPRDREVVVYDQRGVEPNRPTLNCPETERVDFADAAAVLAGYAACHDRLVAEGVDLSAYNTLQNVADLDVMRRTLGYEQVNLYGTSYGARLALQAQRGDPDWLRSTTLSSPIPAEANFVDDLTASYEASLESLADACAADATCEATYGDLRDAYDRVAARLSEEPLEIAVPGPDGAEAQTVQVDLGLFSNLLFSLLYIGPVLPALPALVVDTADGDGEILSLLLAAQFAPPGRPGQSVGMQSSFVCAEEFAYSDRAARRADAAARGPLVEAVLTNPVLGDPGYDLCADWDVPRADPLTFEPVTSDIPTLVVTGSFDPITPPEYGERIVAALPNAHYIEATDQGHAPLLNVEEECGTAILQAFLVAPAAQPDGSCAQVPLDFGASTLSRRSQTFAVPPRPVYDQPLPYRLDLG